MPDLKLRGHHYVHEGNTASRYSHAQPGDSVRYWYKQKNGVFQFTGKIVSKEKGWLVVEAQFYHTVRPARRRVSWEQVFGWKEG